MDEYRRKNALLKDFVAQARRNEKRIERAVHWKARSIGDAFLQKGVTLFTTEIHRTGTATTSPNSRTWLTGATDSTSHHEGSTSNGR